MIFYWKETLILLGLFALAIVALIIYACIHHYDLPRRIPMMLFEGRLTDDDEKINGIRTREVLAR